MAVINTNFIDNVTKVTAAWLNSVNNYLVSLAGTTGSSFIGHGTGTVADALNSISSSTTVATNAASNAATSATNSQNSATLSQQWATQTVSEVSAGQGYGAKKYAVDAASSASAAAGSATTATTQAGNASASASSASTSASTATSAASAASTSATNAAASEGHANTSATNAAVSETNAANSATAAATSATNLATAVTSATTSATNAATSATNAATSAANAQTAAANSASINASNAVAAAAATNAIAYAATATKARDDALKAWAAATYPTNESLAGYSQSIHSGAVVASFVYDVNKDSDGGAWIKRTQQTSWYNETICTGAWIGQAANELAARGDNLLLYPEQFSIATWGKNGATASDNVIIASDGNSYASKLIESATTGIHLINQSFTSVTGLYAGSIDVKAAERSFVAVAFYDGSTVPGIVVNLTTGTFVSNLSAAPVAYSITPSPKGQGWYRVSLVASLTAGASRDLRLYVYKDATTNTYTGDGSSGIYIGQGKVNQVGALSSTYSGSPELVTNGGFDSGTAGWTLASGVSGSNGALLFDGITSIPNGTVLGSQTIQTTPGKVYAVSYQIATSLSGDISSFFGIGSGLVGAAHVSSNVYVDVFVATTTSTVVGLQTRTSTGTRSGSVDNFSVKEVTTLATPYVPYSQLVGQYYQNTTDNKFYSLNSTYGQTEVFRGNSREFPALSAVIAESGRVVIYDLTKPGAPMWMVARSDGSANNLVRGGLSSVAAANGKLYLGHAGLGLSVADFIADTAVSIINSGTRAYSGGITNRNGVTAFPAASGAALVNINVNSIAATILPDAPVDPATGLQVPTIAVATAGGVSVIKQDGTVASDTQNVNVSGVRIDKNDLYCFIVSSVGYVSVRRNFGLVAGSGVDKFGLSSGGEALYRHNTIPALYPTAANGVGVKMAGIGYGRVDGLYLLKENPATPAKGMVAYITNAYNTGYMVGDIRGAYLSDTVAETVAGSGELVTNGTFDTDTSGWTAANGATLSVDTTRLKITNAASPPNGYAYQAISTVAGKSYRVSVDFDRGSSTSSVFLQLGTVPGGSNLVNVSGSAATGNLYADFVATGATTYISLVNDATNGHFGYFDNVSCKLVTPDRSAKNKGLIVNGSITKAAVATGANLVGFSGFSSANYLEQPYNSDLDFGTGDFCVMGWVKPSPNSANQTVFHRGTASSPLLGLSIGAANTWITQVSATAGFADTGVAASSNLTHICLLRVSGTLKLYLNGVVSYSVANTANLTNAVASLRVGLNYSSAEPWLGLIGLLRAGATAPSDDQIAQIYRDELALFQSGAQCTIDGTSSAVTALAYDDSTELLHVGTSWGRTAFNKLVRVESAVTSVGSITSLSAGAGTHTTGGASSGRFYQPALYLRDELRRKAEAKVAAGKEVLTVDTDFITAQTTYTLPYGFTTKNVWAAGSPKRIGSTKDYTTSFDGYRETITFNTSPGAVWVRIDMNRRN